MTTHAVVIAVGLPASARNTTAGMFREPFCDLRGCCRSTPVRLSSGRGLTLRRMWLFTIGDSLSAGFMSAATARTDLSFSTLIASKFGLQPQTDYFFPTWPDDGVPVNIERVLRTLNQRYGSDISGFEWFTVVQTIAGALDPVEDYYERGAGAANQPTPDGRTFYHNVAIAGYTVADAWLVTPALAKQALSNPPADDFLAGPDRAFHRVALKVLNPSLDPAYDTFTQLDWLRHHATSDGVENVIVWLGANNALGTVVTLKISQTQLGVDPPPNTLSYAERTSKGWNLWHPEHFRLEFVELLDRIDAIMANNVATDWRVLLANIPLVTIAPIAKGIGQTSTIQRGGRDFIYYKYYTYFPFEEQFALDTGKYLTMQDAVHIDDTIRAYNQTIAAEVLARNQAYGRERYLVTDMEAALNDLAYKRNGGDPPYQFPEYFQYVYPRVNTKYYHADETGHLTQGGIFSLDGVHPSPIAHGLLSYEFLKVMARAGIVPNTDLNWSAIFGNDLLYTQPISIMQEIYNKDYLATLIVNFSQLLEQARRALP
jgi:hypothetical protein